MTLRTSRFGEIEYTNADIIVVKGGPLGFAKLERFLLIQHKDESVFHWLQSVDDPDVAFLVLDPACFRPDYAPPMPEQIVTDLELTEETPRAVLTIVSIPPGKPQEMTANLAGPIVINVEKRIARQVVVDEPEWSTKHPILAEMRALNEKLAA